MEKKRGGEGGKRERRKGEENDGGNGVFERV